MSQPETTLEKIRALKETIAEKPPYVSGVTPLLPGSTTLFFGQEGEPCRLSLLKPTNESIDLLVKACEPATFGRGDQDVLDETYRKAGKLDFDDFAINFDPARMGLTKAIQTGLLSGKDAERPITLELYKLNVYGPGSFFKAHRDTPRGKSMFGSLVLVLPIQHSGGQLLLRQNGQEWRFDSAQAILAEQPTPSVAYVAFYGDVEHEVLPVEAGHRVTITYNLFYDETPVTLHNIPLVTSAFETALSQLLEDPSFLPDGGILGYPLGYEYPVEKSKVGRYETEIDHVISNLKGVDALVHHACTSLGLEVSVKVAYNLERVRTGLPNPPTQVLKDCLPSSIAGPDPYSDMTDGVRSGTPFRSAAAMDTEDSDEFERDEITTIWWLNEPDPEAFNRQSTVYKSYGNDASLDFMYGNFCFMIEVEPGSREDSPS